MLQVAQARAAYGIARAERSPAVGLGLESQRALVPGDLNLSGQPVISSQHQLGVGFTSWELDLRGRVRSMNKAALHSYWASAEGQRAAHLLLVAQVADGWLAVRELDWRIHLAEQALATRAEARRVFARRVEVGSSSRLDFVQVELLWQQASTLVAQLQSAAQHPVARPGPAGRAARSGTAAQHPAAVSPAATAAAGPGPARATAGKPAGHPGGRTPVAGGQRPHRRSAGHVLPAHCAHRPGRHGQRRLRWPVHLGQPRLDVSRPASPCRCSTVAGARPTCS